MVQRLDRIHLFSSTSPTQTKDCICRSCVADACANNRPVATFGSTSMQWHAWERRLCGVKAKQCEKELVLLALQTWNMMILRLVRAQGHASLLRARRLTGSACSKISRAIAQVSCKQGYRYSTQWKNQRNSTDLKPYARIFKSIRSKPGSNRYYL